MKPFYESKTFWLNVASAALMVALLFLPGGQFAALFSPVIVQWIGVGVAVLNIIVRIFFTDTPITPPSQTLLGK